MFKKSELKFVSALLMMGGSALAPALADSGPSLSKTVPDLMKFENMRIQAEANYDTAALDQELGNNLILVHGSGDSMSKAQYIASIGSQKHDVLSISVSDEKAIIIGNVGITNGIMTNHFKNRDRASSFLGVYVYNDGKWSMIRWQSTAVKTH